jgi:hypothetical protein
VSKEKSFKTFPPFMYLQFGFLIFMQKDFGAKAAHKMLVKFSPGVNFTNTLWAAFASKSFFQKITNPNCKHTKAAQKTFAARKIFLKFLPACPPRFRWRWCRDFPDGRTSGGSREPSRSSLTRGDWTVGKVIKLFFIVWMNKLECLSWLNLSSLA